MQIDIVTIIPAVFDRIFDESVLGTAVKSGLITVNVHNLREYGEGKHRTLDDTPFGGGPGMLFKPAPLISCLTDLRNSGAPAPVIGLTPRGHVFNQAMAKELAAFDRLILVCGRYEGFDERIEDEFDLELSIGDYVLTGGEIPAMAIVDSVARMIPGTVGSSDSIICDSFYDGLLDHPQYTRPADYEGYQVPDVLLEGNHSLIEQYRTFNSILATAVLRPDMLAETELSAGDKRLFASQLKTLNN